MATRPATAVRAFLFAFSARHSVREWINGFRALFGGMPADGGGHATARRPSNAIHRRARLVI
jgi:hypothetical protein